MRLRSLEITAFGAFGGTERIDFTELTADGLFLLHGPTGAGKTTVLDAIAFALYGQVPGDRATQPLKSAYSDPFEPPKVVLEATIGGRDVRITRSPAFERPRKRGSGTMSQPARGTLEWLDERGGENLSRLNDIGATVTALLGMNFKQFNQVVLLPQGQFATFLRSNTAERGDLLAQLFDTARFETMEKWLADRRRTEQATIDQRRQQVLMVLAKVGEAADVAAYDPDSDGDESDWADRQVERSHQLLESARPVLQACEEQAEAAQAEADRRTGLDRDRSRAREARDRLRRHAEGAARRAELKAELAAADRAEKVGWAITRADEAAERLAALDRGVRDHCRAAMIDPDGAATLERARTGDGETDLDRDVLRAAIAAWDTDLAQLAAAAEKEREHQGLVAERDRIARRRAAAEEKISAAQTRLAELPDQITQAESLVTATETVAGTAATRAAELAAARTAAQAAAELIDARAARDAAAAALTAAETAYLSARDHSLNLREQRLAGMAAELAADLEAGRPCTVCGSAEHPDPARPAGDAVTAEDEQAAAAAVEEAATTVAQARADLAEHTTAVTVLEQRGGDIDAAGAQVRVDELAEQAATAERAAADLPGHRDRLAALLAEQVGLQTGRDGLDRELAELTKQHDDTATRITALADQITAAAGTDGSVAARTARIEQIRGQLSTVVEELTRRTDAASAVTAADQAVLTAIAQAGFTDRAAAQAARRPETRRAEITAELDAAARAEAAAGAVLAEPQVIAAGDPDEPVDVAGAVAAAAEADQALVRARREHDEARSRFDRVAARRSEVSAELAALGPELERFRELNELTDVVLGGGRNARNMSLRTYVLAARLEEVVTLATERLLVMSGGRYELIHSDGKVGGERRGGLALDVLDGNTGQTRSTATLSGGEMFMASLSLALGLADVVSSEAGGVRLDTLFIDEGFGTLDAESLDQVMGVLDELRDRGRAVGVVSHVAEMRHRIPSRLTVDKTATGSSLRVSVV